MSVGQWFATPRRLLAIFLVIVLVPSALLVISGWRLMRHEEVVAAQELRSHREQMADDVVTVLKQRVEAVRAQLRAPDADFTLASDRTDFVFAVFNADEVRATPARRLLFYPVTLAGPEVSPVALDAGAIGVAQKLRRMGRTDAALAAYARAAALTNASVAGIPTDLFARYSECLLLAEAGRTDQLRAKATALHADLVSSRWQLNHAAFQANLEDAARWSGAPPLTPALERARALSTAVRWMWDRWKASPAALTGSGSDLLVVDGDVVGPPDGKHKGSGFTLVWSADRDRLAVFVASLALTEQEWLADARQSARRAGLRIELYAPGAPRAPFLETRQPAEETDLPWTVAVAQVLPPNQAARADRLRLFIGGAALLLLIVAGGATVIARAAARELAVARLQSDFVAAVSHEFRTPLTSLRQIGEVLHDGRVSEDKRRGYYEALVRQTERLHRLVETLLDFGRMEAGRSPYHRAPLDLSSFVGTVVDQFNREINARGYVVEVTGSDDAVPVLADGQALSNAIWNLLDNAVKYSPDCRTVWVTVGRHGRNAEVRVRDRGIGISIAEQSDIFGKFVRGSEAKRQNIPGTGIGLAMVRHIIQAHGGSVRVESRPGDGSTFSLVIPCHAS